MANADAKYNYIDHFYTKSAEEFVQKLQRGSAVKGDDKYFKFFRIIRFFNINKIKSSKFAYIINKLGIHFCE